jgi:hypothetical protein
MQEGAGQEGPAQARVITPLAVALLAAGSVALLVGGIVRLWPLAVGGAALVAAGLVLLLRAAFRNGPRTPPS